MQTDVEPPPALNSASSTSPRAARRLADLSTCLPMCGRYPAGCAAAAMCGGVAVEVEPAPSNGRCLFAGVDITAPTDVVWQALTDYDGLDSFIPGVCQAEACGLVCKPPSGLTSVATGL